MSDLKGLVNDPSFQTLSPDEQKKAVVGVEPDAGKLGDGEYQIFVNSLRQKTPAPTENPADFSLSKTVQNVPSSAMNLAKNLGTAITHPVTTAMQGVVRPIAGAIENIPGIPNALKNPEDLQSASSMKDFFVKRYGSIDAAKQTLQNDPVGFAADISGVLGGVGGIASKAGELGDIAGLSKAGAVASKVGEVVNPINATMELAKGAGQIAGKVGTGGLGLTTGLGFQNIKEINDAAAQTPHPILQKAASAVGVDLPVGKPELNAALEGKIGQPHIYDVAMKAVQEMKDKRALDYAPRLQAISKISEPLDLTPVLDEFQKKLKDYHIDKTPDGQLDFSHSIFARDVEGRSTVLGIQKMLNDFANPDSSNLTPVAKKVLNEGGANLQQEGKFQTPEYVDILKRNLQNEYSPSDKARAFAASLGDKANSVLEKVPGYSDMTKNYDDATQTLRQVQDALSLKDNGNVSTAITKLQAALRQSFEFRQSLLDELNKHADMDLKTAIAGNQANQILPRGIAQGMIGALGAMNLSTRVPVLLTKPAFWAGIGAMSPKVVGSTLSAIGYPAKVIGDVLNTITKNKLVQQGALQGGRMQNADTNIQR